MFISRFKSESLVSTLLSCVYTEGGVEAWLQVSSASAQTSLCNDNRRKDILTELFLSDVILHCLYFKTFYQNKKISNDQEHIFLPAWHGLDVFFG